MRLGDRPTTRTSDAWFVNHWDAFFVLAHLNSGFSPLSIIFANSLSNHFAIPPALFFA